MTEEQEQCCIVETAAKTMKNDIKELHADDDSCSSPDGTESSERVVEYLPESLNIVLDKLFVRKEKSVLLVSIGQTIMQQVRPREWKVTL